MPSPPSDLTTHFENIIVRAGAGAGKTRDLVHKVLALEEEIWAKHGRHAHLVVTTFTRKATQELRERLMALALEKNNANLIEFVQRPSHLHISTIHGILSVYLTRFGSDLGLGPHFKILPKNQLKKFNKKIFRQVLKNKTELADAAAELLETQDLNRLLETLESYYHLWCQGRARRATKADLQAGFLREIRQAQEEIAELIRAIESETVTDKWLAYAEQLRGFSRQVRATENLDELRSHVVQFIDSSPSPRKSPKISEDLAAEKSRVHKKIESWTENRYSDEFFDEHERVSSTLETLALPFCESLFRQKVRTGFLSLSDLELLSFRLAHDFPRTAELFSSEWDYWLVDEYQDTSPLQVELLRLLMGSQKSYTVGDPQQSIYLFRGARSEVFGDKEKFVEAALGQRLLRMTNYRSRPALLHYFNDIFVQTSSGQFRAMQVGYSKELREVETEATHYIRCENVDEEVQSALARVQELQKQGVALEQICILARSNDLLESVAQAARPLAIPVQVHSSTQFSVRREVQDAAALLKFLVNPSDNYNFLQLMRAPWLKVPDRRLHQITRPEAESYFLAALKQANFESSAERETDNPDEWTPVRRLQGYLRAAKTEGLSEVWLRALVELGVIDLSQKIDASGRREANLWKLVSLVKQAERQPGFSVLEFLDQLTEVQVDSEGDSDATPVVEPQRVNLMTVHASKGLQFQYVIILGLGKRPQLAKTEFFMADPERSLWSLSLMDLEQDKQVASPLGAAFLEEKKARELLENERVFYVAVTRAVLGVTLIWSDVAANSWASLLPAEIRATELTTSEELWGETHNYAFKIRKGPLESIAPTENNQEVRLTVREKYRPPSPRSMLVKTSVTEILDQQSLSAEEEFKTGKRAEASLHGLEKAVRGVEIHRLFEGLKYKENLALDNPQFQKAFGFVRDWQQGRLLQIIRNGEVEWGFALAQGPSLIQGQIDLWGADDQGQWFIVDYKTGSTAHQEKAFQQLEIYASALRRMKKIPPQAPLNMLVVYPLEEKIFERLSPQSF